MSSPAPEPGTVTVHLDAAAADLEDPSAVARQIPLASSVSPGTRVVVPAAARRKSGLLGRLLGPRTVDVSRAARCSALLARGYVDVGADDGAAWGRAP